MVFWSSRPESAPASLRQGKRKLVPCSIPGCGEEVFNMKKHIEQDHAPAVFDYYQHPSMELTRSRVQCLVQMVQAIFEGVIGKLSCLNLSMFFATLDPTPGNSRSSSSSAKLI